MRDPRAMRLPRRYRPRPRTSPMVEGKSAWMALRPFKSRAPIRAARPLKSLATMWRIVAVPPGRGMKAGDTVGTILQQMGLSNFSAKVRGRRNPYSVARDFSRGFSLSPPRRSFL